MKSSSQWTKDLHLTPKTNSDKMQQKYFTELDLTVKLKIGMLE